AAPPPGAVRGRGRSAEKRCCACRQHASSDEQIAAAEATLVDRLVLAHSLFSFLSGSEQSQRVVWVARLTSLRLPRQCELRRARTSAETRCSAGRRRPGPIPRPAGRPG